ncbi:MAG: alpha/beta hydrolase [Phycisphaerales bacterium]|nr:MAG: alpha/beta hydrolase [Phycisphaerales bacterium]
MPRLAGDRWFYYPSREAYAHPADFDLTYESVFFDSPGTTGQSAEGEAAQVRLHGWFFPAGAEPKGTVIHCHGNAGNITGHFQFVAWMPAWGWNVFCFDYRGFGQSEGRPSRPGSIADTHAAIEYVRSRDDVDATRLVLFGQSLGGAIGIVASADREDLRGVAIEGAFSDYRREAGFVCRRSLLFWPFAPFARFFIAPGFDAIDYVERIAPTPLLMITGSADGVCDYRQTLDLHAAAGEPKSLWVIEGGRHTAALTETDGEGERRLDAFFTQCVAD